MSRYVITVTDPAFSRTLGPYKSEKEAQDRAKEFKERGLHAHIEKVFQ